MACLGSATPTPEWLTARAGAWGAGSASTEDEGAAPSTTRVGGDFGAAAEADAVLRGRGDELLRQRHGRLTRSLQTPGLKPLYLYPPGFFKTTDTYAHHSV